MKDHAETATGAQPKDRFLTYHAVDPARSSSPYDISCSRFEGHLKMAVELERFGNEPAGLIGITFDDGHESNFTHAAPLLENYRKRGTFFVVAGFINRRHQFMTWAQLRELSERGHDVQSHSWSHPLLTHCSEQELDDELLRSRRAIEDKLGKPVDALGVPGGRWDGRVLRAAAKAGYRRLYVSDPFLNLPGTDRDARVYGRITIKHGMSTDDLRCILRGRGLAAWDFSIRYRAKETLRRLVGDHIYRRMWATFGKSSRRDNDQAAELARRKACKSV